MTVKDESYKLSKQRNCIIQIGNSFEEDITDYITSVDVNHTITGDNYLLSEVNPSTAGFQVKNFGDYFKNKQLSKLPIKIQSGYSGLNDEVFRGYLKRDSYRVGTRELSLSSESYLQVFKKEIVNKEVLENFFIEDIVKRAIQECVTDGTLYELQRTGIRIPICNLNEFENWSSLLKLLVQASLYVLVYEDNKFRFRKFYNSTLPSVYSFDVDNIKELVQTKSADDIKNTIILSSNYKSVAPKDKLSENLVNQTQVDNEAYTIQEGYNNRIKIQNFPLYKNQELVDGVFKYKTDTTVFIVDENSPNFGQKVNVSDLDVDNGYVYLETNLQTGLKVSVSYKYLQLQLNPGQERQYVIELNEEAKNIQLLCAAWKNTSQFDSGERVPYATLPTVGTVHLVDVIEQKDNKIRFKLKNNTTSIITISTLQAYGNPIKAFSPIKGKYKNPFSVTKYGEKVLEVANDFIVSEQQARDIGVFLYSNCSDLIERIEVDLPQHMPFLKIGDRVTVTENSTSINYDFMITSIRHSYNENEWNTSFSAIKYPVLLENIVPEYLTKDNQGDYITSTLFNDTPLPTPSNLVTKYNNNTDGSKNISLAWSLIEDIQSPIDGYEIFISVKNQTGTYTVDFQNDIHFQIRPESRGLILRNLPHSEKVDTTDFFKYYAFAIKPFRNVHPEISPDKSGILQGNIVKFTDTYKRIDEFTVYNGTTIEDSVSGVIETTSVSILNTMLNAVKKNETFANSLRFDDFKGMRVIADTGTGQVDRVVTGQFAPNKFGQQIRNGDNEVVFQADETGVKMNVELQVGTTLKKSDGTTDTLENLAGIDQVARDTANQAQTDATNAQNSANQANTEITNMTSDDKISPVEKISLKTNWDTIFAEKSILENQATSYGITTEKTDYVNKYNTLNTYLNTTTTLFSNMSTTTDLGTGGGNTLRTHFTNYYTSKVNLLNKVANVTKAIADTSVQKDVQYNGVKISTTNGVQVFDASAVERLKMGGLGNSQYGFKATHNDMSYSQMAGEGFFRYVNVSTSSSSVSNCSPTSAAVRISNYKDFVIKYINGVAQPTPITISYNGVSETVNIIEIEPYLYAGQDTAWLYFAPGNRTVNTYPSGSLVTQDLVGFPKTYFYLSYIGVVSNEGYLESNSSTPPLTMWIELPKEFRGKPFKVIAMPSDFSTTVTEVEVIVTDYDYTNGKFQVRACTWNSSTSQYGGIKFTYIAIV